MKINDGSSWKEAKSLRIHNGATWLSAKKAYVYDNGWKISYPNLPQSSGLTMLYSGTAFPSIPTTWSIIGNWNTDPAYAPVSFTYQWKRGGIDISGANSSTYTTTASDVDSNIGVTVVATNERGNTTVSQSTGSVTLPTISSMSAYDSTPTPSQPSVSISSNYLNYSGSWTSSSNATSYNVTSNNGTISTNSNQTFSGSGSAGAIAVTVTPFNTNKTVYIFWTAATGASSYDIVKYGNGATTTVNVPSSSTSYSWSIADGNETNQFTVYPKSPSGYQGYGISQSVTVSNKTGTAGSASASLTAVPVPSGGSASLSPYPTVQARNTITASTTFTNGNVQSYEIQIRKATGSSPADENSGTQVALASLYTTSHVITDSEASGTPDQFAAFGRAYNAGGWSPWVKSNTVTSTPYVPPVTTFTISYNANGGSGGGDVSFTTGTSTAPGAPSRSGYTFGGWYVTGANDYEYYVGAGGTWTPPTISVSNSYDGLIGGKYQWTLTITTPSSTAATAYSWGVQFSASNGGAVISSTTGSGGSIPAGGSVTVTRNHATATWARWVSVDASNAYGTSTAASTGWA